MPNPRLAARYAKSLIDLATEKGQLEQVYADMKYLQAVCQASKEFVALLKSPIIKNDQKNSIVTAVTKGKVSELTAAFNTLLVKKGRESDLPEIAYAFVDQYNEIKGIHRVKLTTAVAVGDDLKKTIEQKVQSAQGLGTVELETAVDEKLIGGFVLEFNNRLVDASILRDLKDIKKQFSKNLFVQNIR
ncbi:MAG: ATP synthase F1 subunit delta [Chitinophagaceae bacterium]|nr:ATP synthase F1 subunit delta [Chitinophagaceae bacterium]MCA6451630.1 ATP synthase F1 subunit delta [Chitinophagaceae bacterium]MCA6460243.1 ATP synthase F1 subunit delta [Chitinophagaceae bacterium]MCA6465130.1 ATP synthase F1 subunit delta [Chitinophagaceae bacterium]MEA3427442.1 ATP synthase F1 subunit delta [Bacteroidota bacterium]